MIVNIVLGLYFAVCIGVVLFNCHKLLSEIVGRKMFERTKNEYMRWVCGDGIELTTLPSKQQENEIKKISEKLSSIKRMMAFNAAIDELEKTDKQAVDECLPLIARIMQGAFPFYAFKSYTKQAYYSFLITRFRVMQYVPAKTISRYLIEQIRQDKNIYNLENALRAVYSSGQTDLVMEALSVLDGTEDVRIHEKLLVDGLLTFKECDTLIEAIWGQLSRYSPEMRKMLLGYIRLASGNWKDNMIELLNETDEMETKIACMRYFGKYKDNRILPLLCDIGENPDEGEWELSAVCMSVMSTYTGSEIIRLLKKGLCSRNWYVRYNAAVSLHAMNVDEDQIRDIMNGEDKFAKEMLQYRLEINDKNILNGEAVSR